MHHFVLNGKRYQAADCVDGVLIDPKLPANFDNQSNESRPASQRKWWGLAFIETETVEALDAYYAGRTDEYADKGRELWAKGRQEWMDKFPTGVRYTVRALDGGAWDRSTWKAGVGNLAEAVAIAKACAGSVYTDWPGARNR